MEESEKEAAKMIMDAMELYAAVHHKIGPLSERKFWQVIFIQATNNIIKLSEDIEDGRERLLEMLKEGIKFHGKTS